MCPCAKDSEVSATKMTRTRTIDRIRISFGQENKPHPLSSNIVVARYILPRQEKRLRSLEIAPPRQLRLLPPPSRAHPTARANSELDKTWGQGQMHGARGEAP